MRSNTKRQYGPDVYQVWAVTNKGSYLVAKRAHPFGGGTVNFPTMAEAEADAEKCNKMYAALRMRMGFTYEAVMTPQES